MIKKLNKVVLTVMVFASLTVCKDNTISLKWIPTDDFSHYDDITIDNLLELRVKIKSVSDNRKPIRDIGINVEKTKEDHYYTDDNVASWSLDRIGYILEQFGVNLVTTRPDILIAFEILRFYVTEGSTYSGDVAFKVSAYSNDNRLLWTGVVAGNSRKWGRSFSSENYLECICNSFMEATCKLLKNDAFLNAAENNQAVVPPLENVD